MNLILKINIIIILSVFCYQAAALEPKIATTGNVGFSLMKFNYQEFKENGESFNNEQGILPGLTLGLMKNFQPGYIATTFSYYLNEVDYEGETQKGMPLETRTDEKLFDFSFQLGQQFKPTSKQIYQGYIGFGYHQWQRDILPTSTVLGLFETYQWWYGLLGVKSILPISQQSKLMINLRLMYPLNPTIKIDFNGIFDEQQFKLNEQWGKYFSLAWQYQYNDLISISVEPYLEYWDFAQSASQTLTRRGQTVGSLFEPRSEMHNYGLTITLQRSFW
jgi:hypothetical protein